MRDVSHSRKVAGTNGSVAMAEQATHLAESSFLRPKSSCVKGFVRIVSCDRATFAHCRKTWRFSEFLTPVPSRRPMELSFWSGWRKPFANAGKDGPLYRDGILQQSEWSQTGFVMTSWSSLTHVSSLSSKRGSVG